MERKRSLLEKFGIPLNHLDFTYVRECNDPREMERILQILRSGEEGYFPDLTKAAEDKLRTLKPNSKLFRHEEDVIRRSRRHGVSGEWRPFYDWSNEIRALDIELLTSDYERIDHAPMREYGTIELAAATAAQNFEYSIGPNTSSNSKPSDKSLQRIGSTDYSKWDKYDADEVCLRMDLDEERVKQEVERKNRLNLLNSQKYIAEPVESEDEPEETNKLTDVERDKFGEHYHLMGNDFFRAREYEQAIREYTRAININPKLAAVYYNNRAAANMRLSRYNDAIDDCTRSIELDPTNIKARVRLARSTQFTGNLREAYDVYLKILELDPENDVAMRAVAQLQRIYGVIPPLSATRISIQEKKTTSDETPMQTNEQPSTSHTAIQEKTANDDQKLMQEKEESVPTPSGSRKAIEENKPAIETKPTQNNEQPISKQSRNKIECKPDEIATPAPKTSTEPEPKPKDYDLAGLIVPNNMVKNKLAKAAENFANLKLKSGQNTPETEQPTTSLRKVYSQEFEVEEAEWLTPSKPGKSSKKVLIEEM